jgi:hypothetical protein
MAKKLTREAFEAYIDGRLRDGGSSLEEMKARLELITAPCSCEYEDCQGWALKPDPARWGQQRAAISGGLHG